MTQRDPSDDETLAKTQFAGPRPAESPPPITPSMLDAAVPGAASSLLSMAPPGTRCARQVLGGRYELLCLVGAGGMGNVYRARDLELDEVVALKTLRREIADKPGVIERFRREVRLARRVTHANVARVFDIGEHDGDKFLTMEYVEGESLADELSRDGALRIDRAVEIARAVCAGLAAAHKAGVIHRDLKPDNVLIAKDGRVVLTDFGIARAFDAAEGGGSNTIGVTVGTPAYMAPEQVQGLEDIDGRADIYALGAMLFEMFTGQRAWRGDGAFAVAAAKLIKDPPDPRSVRPDLPPSFARAILRCMSRDREARFATAEAVAEELATLTQPAAQAAAKAPTPCDPLPPPAAAPAAGDKIVAVLPFRNQGPADDEFLADELTDDLIDTLSMTRGLKVRPRGVVNRWKGADQDPREVGRELGVQVVVDGTVRRRAGTARISARLISVADGFQLWARRLDRPEQEMLKMSDEVAQAIAEALTAEAAPAREAPTDPVALELFLRGRHEYRKFWPPQLRNAIALYEQALARTPGDPMILAACALARCRLWFFTGEGAELVADATDRAMKAAPDLAEPRLALASLRLQDGDAPTAVRELKRALSRNPGLTEAQSLLGSVLLEAGDVEDGLRWTESAIRMDATAPLARPALARAHALLGRWDEADAVLAPAIQQGDHQWGIRTRLVMWRRDLVGAEEILRAMEETISANGMAQALLHILRKNELPAEVPDFFAGDLASHAPRRRAFMFQMRAEMHGHLGHADETIAALQGSVDAGLIDVLWLERCPELEVARRDPRYAPLHAAVRRRADAVLAAYRER